MAFGNDSGGFANVGCFLVIGIADENQSHVKIFLPGPARRQVKPLVLIIKKILLRPFGKIDGQKETVKIVHFLDFGAIGADMPVICRFNW